MTTGKRLIMRYQTGSALVFSKIKPAAKDLEILNLGEAFAHIQAENPLKIIAGTTRQVI